jgi:adenylate kinase family enzyme
MDKYKLIFIMGGPASGKGTLCAKLTKDKKFAHVSPGDLVRAKKDLNPELNELMKDGKLLPSSFIGKLIMEQIRETVTFDQIVLLDGFPRDQDNLDYYLGEMANFFDLIGVFVLDCDDETMLNRAVKRGENTARIDDSREICKKRIEQYHDKTEVIINNFDKNIIQHISSKGSDDETYNTFHNMISY